MNAAKVGLSSTGGPAPAGPERIRKAAPGAKDPRDAPSRPRLRVLLVDDNATALRLLARLLTHAGMDVETSTDSLEAVDHAGRENFDVMFVDLRMSPIGGLEVLRRTQGLVPRRYILTGYAEAADEAAALALGATAVLHKPFDANEMLDLILDEG